MNKIKVIELTDSLISAVNSYDRVAKIHNDIIQAPNKEVEVRIGIEKRLGLSFLFYISTLPFLGKAQEKTIKICCNKKTTTLLKQAGYLDKTTEVDPFKTDISPLLEQKARKIKDKNDIFEIVREINRDTPVEMNENLEELFISKVGEMFINALEHSGAEYILGANYFKNQKNIYCFSCYDTGIGIPQKVISSTGKCFTDEDALKWAMIKGNSTANIDKNIPRGLGLELLHAFAKANNGTIRICSGKAFYMYNASKGVRYYTLHNNFNGTLYEMDIIADNEHRYIL